MNLKLKELLNGLYHQNIGGLTTIHCHRGDENQLQRNTLTPSYPGLGLRE